MARCVAAMRATARWLAQRVGGAAFGSAVVLASTAVGQPGGDPGPLSRNEAEALVRSVAADRRLASNDETARVIRSRQLSIGDTVLRWTEHVTGEVSRSSPGPLWIALHSGGGSSQTENDRRWGLVEQLVDIDRGILLAPRAPTDTWDKWASPETVLLVGRLVELYVADGRIDPDRVYLIGHAGGADGVYQHATQRPDLFAAAGAISGHPNDAQPGALRALPIAIYAGAEHKEFSIAETAAQWARQLRGDRRADPAGYVHRVHLEPGRADTLTDHIPDAVAWMATHARDPWPDRVVWRKQPMPVVRRYWLEYLDPRDIAPISASVEGQHIALVGPERAAVRILLRDRLVDLDRPIRVTRNGRLVFEGLVPRRERDIRQSLARSLDDARAWTASLEILPVPIVDAGP